MLMLQWEKVPTYEVPAEFEKAALGAVDISSKVKARRSLPLAFKRRWLDLRSKVTALPLLSMHLWELSHTVTAVLYTCLLYQVE